MSPNSVSSGDKDYLNKALDVAVRLAIVAIIVLSCFSIFRPFMMPVIWGIILAVALYPLFLKLKNLMGGRTRLAGTLFILISLAIVIVPTVMLMDSLIDGTVRFGKELMDGTFVLQPPPEKVKTWPLIGEKTYDFWTLANENIKIAAEKIEPQLKALGSKLISTFTALGAAVLFSIIALIIAGIFLMNSEGAGRISRVIGRRLGGEMGVEMVSTAGSTIQSVVKGVILIALIQGLFAGIGLVIAGVPAAGLWAVLVVVVAIIQLPPILILGPIAAWAFSTDMGTVWAAVFAIYCLIISGADGLLKPILLGRGLNVPMLVILIGAIGGMLGAGVVGLFIGPVIFAIGYQIFSLWIEDARKEEIESKKPGSANV
jgi:predicted PurR-regulated permease PerM